MDLRSVKPGLTAVMRHPKTGELLEPVYVWKNGRVSWPVMGGAEDDDSGSGDDDAGDEDEDESEDEPEDEKDDADDSDDDAEKGKKKKKSDPQAKIKALEEEKDRHFKNAKKYKKQAADLEARLKLLEDKAERDKIAQEAKDKATEAATQRLHLENAFLRANEIDWIKPEQALALLLADPDEYEVEFDDSGKVDRKSLRAELKRLAKANPHLVKPKQSKGKDDEEDADDAGSQRQTASTMNGTRKGKKDKPKTREELAKRFPALNRIGS